MSNKHKHYEMIVAKVANMSLVKFIKMDGKWENAGLSDKFISFSEEYDYFLCLPQHKEACLHWLNGGEAQVMDSSWVNMFPIENYPWEGEHDFMDDEASIRIKPKKEKRWIATFPWSGNVFYVTPEHFETKEMLSDYVYMYYGKQALMVSHQIEVEV